jgi:hypothetical protein
MMLGPEVMRGVGAVSVRPRQLCLWVGLVEMPACRCENPAQGAAAPKTRTPGSAAIVEGHLIAVGVRERESAAERPVDGR